MTEKLLKIMDLEDSDFPVRNSMREWSNCSSTETKYPDLPIIAYDIKGRI
jgi:hypothetical protein